MDRKLSLALYNELAVFYEIEQGDEDLYTGNKNAVLGGLLSYLKPEGALESRVRLNDMFLERFDREYDLIRKKGYRRRRFWSGSRSIMHCLAIITGSKLWITSSTGC